MRKIGLDVSKDTDVSAFRTTIFLTTEQKKKLGHLAVDENTTKGDIIRKAIIEYFNRKESVRKK